MLYNCRKSANYHDLMILIESDESDVLIELLNVSD